MRTSRFLPSSQLGYSSVSKVATLIGCCLFSFGCDKSTSSGGGGGADSIPVVLAPVPVALAHGMDFGDGGIPGNPSGTSKVPVDALADTGTKPDRVSEQFKRKQV